MEQAAAKQDVKTIIKYLDDNEYEDDAIPAQRLFELMFPGKQSKLPLCYTRPEEFILKPYMDIDRKRNVPYDLDREMLRPLLKEIHVLQKITSKLNEKKSWIHWIQMVYMSSKNIYYAHSLGYTHRKKTNHRVSFEEVQNYINGKTMDAQQCRSMSNILFIIPTLEEQSPLEINCFVCSDISKNKCSNCYAIICSSNCLNKHDCV